MPTEMLRDCFSVVKLPKFLSSIQLNDSPTVNSRANPARDSRHNPASRNAGSRSLNGWDF